METGDLLCASCRAGRHRWSAPAAEDFGRDESRIRLYRWHCVCQGCSPACAAKRTQMHADASPEVDMGLAQRRLSRPAGFPPGDIRIPRQNLPGPALSSGGMDRAPTIPLPRVELAHVDTALMARVLHGLRSL